MCLLNKPTRTYLECITATLFVVVVDPLALYGLCILTAQFPVVFYS